MLLMSRNILKCVYLSMCFIHYVRSMLKLSYKNAWTITQIKHKKIMFFQILKSLLSINFYRHLQIPPQNRLLPFHDNSNSRANDYSFIILQLWELKKGFRNRELDSKFHWQILGHFNWYILRFNCLLLYYNDNV